MANTTFQLKRSSVAGKQPNTSTLSIGELAINITDKKLYSSDGSVVFEPAGNVTNLNVTSNAYINYLIANGYLGTSGKVLTSNSSGGIYWATSSGGGGGGTTATPVRQQYTANGTANTFTVTDGYSANNLDVYLNGVKLQNGYEVDVSSGDTFKILTGNPSPNSFIEVVGAIPVTTTSVVLKTGDTMTGSLNVGNTTVGLNYVSVGNSSVNTQVNSGNILLNGFSVVTNTQLTSNLSNYQTTAGLSSNVATLAANSATYLNGNTASDLRTYSDTKASDAYSNSVSYTDTKAATAYSNATSYTDSKIATANSAITANAATAYSNAVSYTDTKAAAAYTNATSYTDTKIGTANTAMVANAAAAYSNAVTYVGAQSFVNTSQLSANLANYQTSAGLNANIASYLPNYTGTVNATSITAASGQFTGNVSVSSLIVTGNVEVIGANNLSVTDNMIYLNSNSTFSNPDIGFAANYNDGTYHHTGIFRDHSSGTWKVFDNYAPEPDASQYIDQTNSTFHIANFQANTIYVGNNSVYATLNTTSFSGTANNAAYLNNKTESNLNVNSALTSNSSAYIGTLAAANVVSDSELSSNLANYAVNTTVYSTFTQNTSLSSVAFSGSYSDLSNIPPKYVNMTQTGTITGPFTGTSRYYPPVAITISQVSASVSTSQATNCVFKLFKNGVDTGYTFTINSGSNLITPVSVSIALTTTDYLTLNLVSGTFVEFKVQLKYS